MKFLHWSVFAMCLMVTCLAAQTASAAQRIVTIGGMITEIVYALGAEDRVVGNDTTSYYPPAAESLPKVGYMRALSAEGILSLDPDLLIVDEDAGPPPVLDQIKATGVQFLNLKTARSFDGLFTNIREIAAALGRETDAENLLHKIKAEVIEIDRLNRGGEPRKKVMFILAHGRTPLVAGKETTVNQIITLAGAQNVVQGYTGFKPLASESAIAMAPDVILTTDQVLEQSGGKDALLEIPGISLTPAGRTQTVLAMDGLLLLGFGPRTAKAAKDLNALVYGQ